MKNNHIAMRMVLGAVALSLALTLPSFSAPVGKFLTKRISITKSWTPSGTYKDGGLGEPSSFTAAVDYPQDGNATTYPSLDKSVRQWISDYIMPEGHSAVLKAEVVEDSYKDFLAWSMDDGMGAKRNIEILKVYEDNEYISYKASKSYQDALTDGTFNQTNLTFRKSDGRAFSWKNIANISSVRKAITQKLAAALGMSAKEMMSTVTENAEDMKVYRLPDGSLAMPLPESNPAVVSGGWSIQYDQYELWMLIGNEDAPEIVLPKGAIVLRN